MENNITVPDLLLDYLGRCKPGSLAENASGLTVDEWNELVSQACDHGAGPLLFFKLSTLVPDGTIPLSAKKLLHQSFLQSAARNVLIYRQLGILLQAFRDAGIPVIVLKGGYLAEAEYEEVSLRPMDDIDILLQKNDLGRGEDVLKSIGYDSLRPFIPEVDSVHHQHILPFTHENGIPVEVHWNIFDPQEPFHEDVDGLWQRSSPCTIAGVDARVLCLEDMLLHLSIHSAYHHCFDLGLIKLYDISLLLQNHGDDLDWQGLFERAEKWGFDRCLLLTLHIVSDLLGAYLSGEAETTVNNAVLEPEVVQLAVEQLFKPESGTTFSPTMTDFVGKEGGLNKGIFLLSRIFPSKMEMARMYPVSPDSAKIYLYYFVRIKDLLRQYGEGVWRVARKDETALSTLSLRQKKDKLQSWMRREV